MPNKKSGVKLILQFIAAFIVLAGLLFGSAGTFRWTEAWIYLAIHMSFSGAMAVWLIKNNPALLKERMRLFNPGAQNWDKLLMKSLIPAFLALYILPGLDAVRFQWTQIPLIFKLGGFAGIIFSLTIVFWAVRTNSFLSRVVVIQKDRGHTVITGGPYRFVRHPMYVGVINMVLSIPATFGSLWSYFPAGLIVAVIIIRTHFEDKFLHQELEGYSEYAQKVRYRLFPGLW